VTFTEDQIESSEEVKGPARPIALSEIASVEEAPVQRSFRVSDIVSFSPDESSLKALDADAQTLAADPAFDPTAFYLQNEELLGNNPEAVDKLARVLKEKKLSLPGIAKAAVPAAVNTALSIPRIVRKTQDAAVELGKQAALVPLLGFNTPETPGFKKAIAELGSAAELNTAEYAKLGKGLVDKLADVARKDPIAPALTGTPESEPDMAEWRERLLAGAELTRSAQNAGEGKGKFTELVGLTPEVLKESGVEVSPENIQDLSWVADPLILTAAGKGFKIATAGEKLVATAATKSAAETFLTAARNASRKAAAAAIEKVGKTITRAGTTMSTTPGRLAAGIVGSLATGNLAGAAGALVLPAVVRKTGRAIAKTGAVLGGTEVPSAGVQRVSKLLGSDLVRNTAKAANPLTNPAAIAMAAGAGSDEEAGNVLGSVSAFSALGAAVGGTGKVAKEGAKAAADAVVARRFRELERQPLAKFDYGSDPALDADHSQALAILEQADPRSANQLNFFRSVLPPEVEMYILSPQQFSTRVGQVLGQPGPFHEKGFSYADPSGVTRVFLNRDTLALGHEVGHALEILMPQNERQGFVDAIRKAYPPEQIQQFGTYYDSLLGPAAQGQKMAGNQDRIVAEMAAEILSKAINSEPLTGMPPSATDRALRFLARLAEDTGLYEPGVNKTAEEGGSALGVKPSVRAAEAGIAGVPEMQPTAVYQGAPPVIPATPPAPAPATPAAAVNVNVPSPTVPPTTPISPAPPASPAPVPLVPAAPVPIQPVPGASITPGAPLRNLRVTRADQALGNPAPTVNGAADAEAAIKANPAAYSPESQKAFSDINNVLKAPQGEVVPVRLEYESVKESDGSGKDAPRRKDEQTEAYVEETLGALPEDVRELVDKVTIPDRWETRKGGNVNLRAFSVDKILANARKLVERTENTGFVHPYETGPDGYTPAGWRNLASDLQAYLRNIANGYKGDGTQITVPAGYQGRLAPENQTYRPTVLPKRNADFFNLLMGVTPPETSRTPAGFKDRPIAEYPNVQAAALATANARPVIQPSRSAKGGKDTYSKPGDTDAPITETNPLRDELLGLGVNLVGEKLFAVTEELNLQNIKKVTPLPQSGFRAPLTDPLRAGFLPELKSK